MKLFSVFLGGRADKCNTELHDVVFTIGEKIEDTYFDLLGKWFGLPDRLHIDSWVVLNIIEGYKISLSKEKKKSDRKLYFVNLGAYEKNRFEELHESKFMVDINKIFWNGFKTVIKNKFTLFGCFFQVYIISRNLSNFYAVIDIIKVIKMDLFFSNK